MHTAQPIPPAYPPQHVFDHAPTDRIDRLCAEYDVDRRTRHLADEMADAVYGKVDDKPAVTLDPDKINLAMAVAFDVGVKDAASGKLKEANRWPDSPFGVAWSAGHKHWLDARAGDPFDYLPGDH